MLIDASSILVQIVDITIGDDGDPCGSIVVPPIEIDRPVRIIWRLPTKSGYLFSAAGVGGLAGPDFGDSRFDDFGRRLFGWTARRPGSAALRNYSIAIEWVDDDGVLQTCSTGVSPSLRIINRS